MTLKSKSRMITVSAVAIVASTVVSVLCQVMWPALLVTLIILIKSA